MTWHEGITTFSVIAFAVVGLIAMSSREALAQSAGDQGPG